MGGVLNTLDPDEERIHELESRSEEKNPEGSTELQKDEKYRKRLKI